jgi:hypothetical protein
MVVFVEFNGFLLMCYVIFYLYHGFFLSSLIIYLLSTIKKLGKVYRASLFFFFNIFLILLLCFFNIHLIYFYISQVE